MPVDQSSLGHPDAAAGEKDEPSMVAGQTAAPAEPTAVEQAGEEGQTEAADAAEALQTAESAAVSAGTQEQPSVAGDDVTKVADAGEESLPAAEGVSEKRAPEPESELDAAVTEPSQTAVATDATKEEAEAAAAVLAATSTADMAEVLASNTPEDEAAPFETGDGTQSSLSVPEPASGGSKAAKRRVNLPTNPVPELQLLTFHSWWTEMNTKRYIEICFDMKTELFQVVLDKEVKHLASEQLYSAQTESVRDVTAKDTKVMSMHLHEKLSGNQHARSLRRSHLCQWDLHVGAKLNILGRPTTLMQCSFATGQWLDYQAERLTRIKKALEEQLRRYETMPQPPVLSAKRSEKRKNVGTTDLRVLLNLIDGLQQRLGRYRPTIAAGIAALVERQPVMHAPIRLES